MGDKMMLALIQFTGCDDDGSVFVLVFVIGSFSRTTLVPLPIVQPENGLIPENIKGLPAMITWHGDDLPDLAIR